MAGDTLRDAFRAKLDAVIAAASPSIAWVRRDTLNTGDNPDASGGYIDLQFVGGDETQFTFGAPGANLHRELGPVFVHVVAPLASSPASTTERDTAERYAGQIRTGFRMARFAAGSQSVRITATASAAGGVIEGGMWAETIALQYEVFNIA